MKRRVLLEFVDLGNGIVSRGGLKRLRNLVGSIKFSIFIDDVGDVEYETNAVEAEKLICSAIANSSTNVNVLVIV